ncbi:MAG: divergent polysaccharide deacetylase family protein [Pseudomonadota bacterium]|nr:divergent polysaccharide deacetylase family protein [Pseudomonadota bacterium]
MADEDVDDDFNDGEEDGDAATNASEDFSDGNDDQNEYSDGEFDDDGDDEADEDDDGDDEADEDDGDGKKKKLIIGAAATVVIISVMAGGTLMLLGSREDEGDAQFAEAADPNIPRITMAIPRKRKLVITPENQTAGKPAQPKSGARKRKLVITPKNQTADKPAQPKSGVRKRKLVTTDESRPAGNPAQPKFGARKSTPPKKPATVSGHKPALTPPAADENTATGQTLNPATVAEPDTAPRRRRKSAPAPQKARAPTATGARRTSGRGVVTPAVTAIAFRGIPLPPRGKPLKGINSEMVETTDAGTLPKMTKSGKSPWQEYARPFNKEAKRPRIAVILHGIGLSRTATLAAINQLPGDITLAFSPYTVNIGNWMGMARSAGHETLIDLHMEPNDFPISDPGPLAMLTKLKAAENIARLHRVLGLSPGFVGVFQVMGSKFATSEAALTPVLSELQKRGLLYVDSGVPKGSVGLKVAKSIALPRVGVSITLDRVASAAAINSRLVQLEKSARKNNTAVGVAEPYPVTIRRLAEWSKSLNFKKLALAPVSAVVSIDGSVNTPNSKSGDKANKKAEN